MLRIGKGNWVGELKEMTEPLGAQFWSRFKVATEEELIGVEGQIRRPLDPEFREFYLKVGYGDFLDEYGYCGGFYSPDELVHDVSCPIYFVTGSRTDGEEWASEEAHQKLWHSRGRDNPNPDKFTEEALALEGVKLYDLLQFGDNGCGCYHQLYVGPEPAPMRYCLLTDSQEMEDRAATFSEGVEKILAFYLMDPEEM